MARGFDAPDRLDLSSYSQGALPILGSFQMLLIRQSRVPGDTTHVTLRRLCHREKSDFESDVVFQRIARA